MAENNQRLFEGNQRLTIANRYFIKLSLVLKIVSDDICRRLGALHLLRFLGLIALPGEVCRPVREHFRLGMATPLGKNDMQSVRINDTRTPFCTRQS